jgi:hypothetical protein
MHDPNFGARTYLSERYRIRLQDARKASVSELLLLPITTVPVSLPAVRVPKQMERRI